MMFVCGFVWFGWVARSRSQQPHARIPSLLSRHYIHSTTCTYAPAVEDGDAQGRQRLGEGGLVGVEGQPLHDERRAGQRPLVRLPLRVVGIAGGGDGVSTL